MWAGKSRHVNDWKGSCSSDPVVELNQGSIRGGGGEHDTGEGHNKRSGNSLI